MEFSNNRGIRYIPRISDFDNPFRAVPVNATPEMLSKSSCSFIAGVPREAIQSFLLLASKAFRGAQPYCRGNYCDGVLVAYDDIPWFDSNEDIKHLIDYLRALGSLNTPVAYARLGDGIDAYANLAGYITFHDKVSWNPVRRKMDFANDYDPHNDI